jgi:hypothetical protein
MEIDGKSVWSALKIRDEGKRKGEATGDSFHSLYLSEGGNQKWRGATLIGTFHPFPLPI